MNKRQPVRKSRDEKILLILKNSEWFKDECKKIRKKYKKSNDEWYLHKEVERLCRLFPDYWGKSVKKYIKDKKLKKPTIEGAQVVYSQDNSTNERVLYIRIFQKTKKENVLKAYKEARKFQKFLSEIWATDIEDNLVILHTWNEVLAREKRPRNITREVSALLKNKYGMKIEDEGDIRKRVSDLRKQLRAG